MFGQTCDDRAARGDRYGECQRRGDSSPRRNAGLLERHELTVSGGDTVGDAQAGRCYEGSVE